MHRRASTLAGVVILLAVAIAPAPAAQSAAPAVAIPRDGWGRPNLHGIWQADTRAAVNLEDHLARHGMPAGRGVVDSGGGGTIPYQPWARKKQQENFAARATADPLNSCYLPGVPRIMYMDFPFQIFQSRNHVAITFEWSQVFRLIYTNGSKPADGIDFWMGDSRGRWDGDTLVVEVSNHNDKTWFDQSGNFHSSELKLVERFTLLDTDTIQYEVTVEDPKVFTAPWRIRMPLRRKKDMARLLEYQCQAELEEANGAFPRDPLTWFPGVGR
jgi:hypothetical protein